MSRSTTVASSIAADRGASRARASPKSIANACGVEHSRQPRAPARAWHRSAPCWARDAAVEQQAPSGRGRLEGNRRATGHGDNRHRARFFDGRGPSRSFSRGRDGAWVRAVSCWGAKVLEARWRATCPRRPEHRLRASPCSCTALLDQPRADELARTSAVRQLTRARRRPADAPPVHRLCHSRRSTTDDQLGRARARSVARRLSETLPRRSRLRTDRTRRAATRRPATPRPTRPRTNGSGHWCGRRP